MSWIVTHFEIVIGALFVLIAAVVVLQQRRTPQSTVAWLLAMVVMPYVAIPLFLALGFRKAGRPFRAISFPERHWETVPDPRHRTDGVLQNLGLPGATTGNRIDLLSGTETAYAGLFELVRLARISLDIEFYIIADDPVGTAFVEALVERARDGVQVRLLLDRWGTLRRPRAALAKLEQAGGEVCFSSPLLQRPAAGHLNLRNHRKLVIADGVRVFAGGMNVGREYMSDKAEDGQWCDLAFTMQGPAVLTCRDVFASDWARYGGVTGSAEVTDPVPVGDATLQVVSSGPDISSDPMQDALVHAIHVATDRIWIATPYFLPTEILSKALTLAARRGVDVRVVLPARSNQKLADFARGAYLREMAEVGVKVMLYQPGMIHAKASVIDDLAYVGSANFDVRSMVLNFEMVVFGYDAGTVGAVADWFTTLAPECSYGLKEAGLLRRVTEGVFRLGAPVL